MSKQHKSQINKYFVVFWIGFIAWIAETAYFGFNKTPANGMEATADVATTILMAYGIIGDLLRNVRFQKHIKNVTNVQTKKVVMEGKPEIASYNVKMPKK